MYKYYLLGTYAYLKKLPQATHGNVLDFFIIYNWGCTSWTDETDYGGELLQYGY